MTYITLFLMFLFVLLGFLCGSILFLYIFKWSANSKKRRTQKKYRKERRKQEKEDQKKMKEEAESYSADENNTDVENLEYSESSDKDTKKKTKRSKKKSKNQTNNEGVLKQRLSDKDSFTSYSCSDEEIDEAEYIASQKSRQNDSYNTLKNQ